MHDPKIKERIGGATNQFAIMTIVSLLASIPLMIIFPIANGKSAQANIDKFISGNLILFNFYRTKFNFLFFLIILN